MRHSMKTKEKAFALFESGHGRKAVAKALKLSEGIVLKWLYSYRVIGKEALYMSTYKHYDYETKLAAVRDFLEFGLSRQEVLDKYQIRSISPFRSWVRAYREGGPDALKPKPKGRPKKSAVTYATREEELEARVKELELELALQKRMNALADEIERKRLRR